MKYFFYFFILSVVFSCTKTSGEKDTIAPTVSITTPTHNQVVPGGQKIYVSGMAADNRYVKQIHIEITNKLTGEELLHIHIHPGSASAAFNEAFTPASGIIYRIRVIVDDASANSIFDEVTIEGS